MNHRILLVIGKEWSDTDTQSSGPDHTKRPRAESHRDLFQLRDAPVEGKVSEPYLDEGSSESTTVLHQVRRHPDSRDTGVTDSHPPPGVPMSDGVGNYPPGNEEEVSSGPRGSERVVERGSSDTEKTGNRRKFPSTLLGTGGSIGG